MNTVNKILPYVYYIIGFILIVKGFTNFSSEKESYYILLGFETKNKFIYLFFRVLFGAFVIYAGITRFKKLKKGN